MKAYCLIRSQPVYRREGFVAGLKAAGFDVQIRAPQQIERGDVLLIWNRYADNDHLADRFEVAGGTVVVAENGYLDPGRDTDRRWYALALDGHNGQGRWPIGTPERWPRIAPRLRCTFAPWRRDGEHIVVCPNRSFGRRGYVMPGDWGVRSLEALRRLTDRQVRLRPHPGNAPAKVPLAEDLQGAWAVVIWASSAGVAALLAGVPVISLAPAWICQGAASRRLDDVVAPPLPDRAAAFERLAWAQWHIEEIASGEPFRRLLSHAREGESAAAS